MQTDALGQAIPHWGAMWIALITLYAGVWVFYALRSFRVSPSGLGVLGYASAALQVVGAFVLFIWGITR